MAPRTRRRKKAQVPAAEQEDRLSALPVDVLQQIVGLLPAQEGVRTSVLARKWRDVWKTTDRLLFTGETVHGVQEFVERLLPIRIRRLTHARLSTCEFSFHKCQDDFAHVYRCILLALMGEVEVLRVHLLGRYYFSSSNKRYKPFVSSHLKRFELAGIELDGSFIDLSSCPALQDLEIVGCSLCVRKITSPSLKRLRIEHCSMLLDLRTRICSPRLVSLRLDCPSSAYETTRTPVLWSMPELVVAHVIIDSDGCSCDDRMGCHHVTAIGSCSEHENDEGAEQLADNEDNQDTRKSVLLGGLSEAVELTLISSNDTYIFRRDLRWCPIFSTLKTLLLNHYWCYPPDCRALSCILQHAPVLEKLTVLFSDKVESKFEVEMTGRLDQKERSVAISKHLRIVEVKCEVVNKSVLNLLSS